MHPGYGARRELLLGGDATAELEAWPAEEARRRVQRLAKPRNPHASSTFLEAGECVRDFVQTQKVS